ncbi:MAG: NADP-dependent isocitrate dehydrogenase [Spirochaetaceae bacterium]
MSTAKKITVARGDGIGPEIMDATLKILEAAAAPVEPEFIEIGREVFLQGYSAGIRPDAWESIRRTKTLLKAPVTTPQGAGYKSLNVTIRKTLGLFANVRPCQSLNPYVETHHPTLDIIIVRENEEDLYAGIEHAQTEDVTQCLKLISRPGSERVIRYAFEYAQQYGRRKVTCMIKDNIMKVTDGLFHRVFDEVAAEYPEIETDQQIIDIGTARLATEPERYDVIVTPNLYGDIISDVVAEVSGSVGMAGSANVGTEMAMFEAIHGSAPDIAGRNIANPSGLINAAVMMLVHLGEPDHADTIHNAWLKAIEDGQHTAEIYREGRSEHMLGTEEFARAVIDRLGEKPRTLRSWHIDARRGGPVRIPPYQRKVRKKELVGSDLFIDWQRDDPEAIGKELDRLSGDALKLKMITNRGVKVYPNGFPETFCTDHWRCRFVGRGTEVAGENTSYEVIDHKALTQLIDRLNYAGYEVIKTENLYLFDGERGFSLGQGE